MGIYILLSKLTPDGRKTLKERPHRIREVDKELENRGVKVLDQFATLGQYDFVNIVDAPDNETIGEVSVDLCARGTVDIITLPAIPVDSLIDLFKNGKIEKKKVESSK